MAEHKVFVYGSLKRGRGNHRLLQGAQFLGPAQTDEDTFRMYDLGAYPGIVHEHGPNHPVKGEVYLVDDDTLKDLDRLEGYPGFYNRKTITVYGQEFANGDELGHTEALVYFLDNMKFWGGPRVVESGEW